MVQLLKVLRFVVCVLPCLVLANTESYMLNVPHYFDIPSHPNEIGIDNLHQRSVHALNATHSLILDYPILKTPLKTGASHTVSLAYNPLTDPPNKILVKLNNYHNDTFSSDDLLYVKVCWPATIPVDFRFGHSFHRLSQFHPNPAVDTFDIYLEIDLSGDIHTYSDQFIHSIGEIQFQLYITKLPCRWIPVPLELYHYIVYVVDISILLASAIIPSLFGILFT